MNNVSVQARLSLTHVMHNFINNVLYSRDEKYIIMDFRGGQSLKTVKYFKYVNKTKWHFVSPLQTTIRKALQLPTNLKEH